MAKKSLYPQFSLEDALILAQTIVKHNSGKPMRRLTLFGTLNKSPESGPSRSLVTASSSYGLTEGGYTADMIKLSDRGLKIVEQNDQIELLNAVLDIEVFKAFFEHYKNSSIPSQVSAIDYLKSLGVSEEGAPTCLNVLLANGRKVSLIQEISGLERIVSYDHALETMSVTEGMSIITNGNSETKNGQTENNEVKQEPKNANSVPKISNIPSLNINIQIHLPSDAKPENYEAIFKNIKTYLMDDK